ncbi:ABC transporter permease [Stappia indica]|uniref:ABC-2 type transport system permease protein n=1 Tax=Stappia indica TaxID=538381 RepID=A0A285ST96_9HYPH|nr:ABC transporter permease [Stappia indica]SOC10947.1 ABC-2 type transport system permease protein [Stappia indica]
MFLWLANVYRLGVKELRSLVFDPVLLLLIVYVFTLAIYAVATGAKLEVQNASVAYVDEDRSALSGRIISAILPPEFDTPVEISADRIDASMDSGAFVFVLRFPPEFEADLLAGRKSEIQLNVDATAMAQAGNGTVFLQSIIQAETAKFLSGNEDAAALPINLVVRAMFNPNLDSSWFNAVMQVINNVTILSVLLTGAALIREREHGTIEHLLVMPVKPSEIMVAKIWANGLAIVVAAVLSLVFVVQLLLGVPIHGSIALFVFGALIYMISVTGLGILIATFTTSMPQFGLLALPVLVIMNLLSGSTTPMESMPEWLQAVMQVSPSTHFVAFAQAILYRGAGLTTVWPSLVAMSVLSAVFFVIALSRFRKTMAGAR